MLFFDKAKRIRTDEEKTPFIGDYCAALDRLNDPEYTLLPGFCDVHVHFREPGFSYKETIRTGSLAAAHGGYTVVCTMPNLNPVPDCAEHLRPQLEAIERSAAVRVIPYGAITAGEKGAVIVDMEALAPYVTAFSDDGHGVQNDDIMRQAMLRAKALGKLIVAHCEDNSLLRGGYIHDGAYSPGIWRWSERPAAATTCAISPRRRAWR